MNIHGIECELSSPEAIETVTQVLDQIRERRPKDFQRLQGLLKKILPLSDEEAADGTLAETKPPWAVEEPKEVQLYEAGEHLSAAFAHECGHVCTRFEDLHRRGECPSDEWRFELAADWYAYRWGFGRAVAKSRRVRDHLHHGPAPGTEFSCYGFLHRVSRSFVCQCLGEDPDTDKLMIEGLIPHAEQGVVTAQYMLGERYAEGGQGVPRDYVAAYKWLSLAVSGATGADRKEYVRVRDSIGDQMSREQIAEAEDMARRWMEKESS